MNYQYLRLYRVKRYDEELNGMDVEGDSHSLIIAWHLARNTEENHEGTIRRAWNLGLGPAKYEIGLLLICFRGNCCFHPQGTKSIYQTTQCHMPDYHSLNTACGSTLEEHKEYFKILLLATITARKLQMKNSFQANTIPAVCCFLKMNQEHVLHRLLEQICFSPYLYGVQSFSER